MNEEQKQEIFHYLDILRMTGVTNMLGAGEYLERDFDLTRHEARKVLVEWMEQFKG